MRSQKSWTQLTDFTSKDLDPVHLLEVTLGTLPGSLPLPVPTALSSAHPCVSAASGSGSEHSSLAPLASPSSPGSQAHLTPSMDITASTPKSGLQGEICSRAAGPQLPPLSPRRRAPPQVQSELRRTWRGLWPSRPSARDYRLHSSSISRTGSDGALQGPRSSRAPSLLQTETSVI